MNKSFILIFMVLVINCAGKAFVEVGLNDDESLLRGTIGDIVMRVTKIELPNDGASYSTLWTGVKKIQVGIHDANFISITDDYIEASPASFQTVRLTVDSLQYVHDATSTMLVDTTFQFEANSFGEISTYENQETQLVINIISDNWFDAESLRIKPGHMAFEGARLNVFIQ